MSALDALTDLLLTDALGPSTCCGNDTWRGKYCTYHQGYQDGLEALAEYARTHRDKLLRALDDISPDNELWK